LFILVELALQLSHLRSRLCQGAVHLRRRCAQFGKFLRIAGRLTLLQILFASAQPGDIGLGIGLLLCAGLTRTFQLALLVGERPFPRVEFGLEFLVIRVAVGAEFLLLASSLPRVSFNSRCDFS
jgi:hypothetical protein